MSLPQAHRRVWIIDGQAESLPNVPANLYRGLPSHVLDEIENSWASARETAARDSKAVGLNPLEHAHWDWRGKAKSVEDGSHMLVAIENGIWEGVMAVARLPRSSRLGIGSVVYVDFLETAPWNLRLAGARIKYKGVGMALLVDSIRLSFETGLGGGVGLHSLPQAEQFYAKFGMRRVGEDPDYYGLPYYEFSGSLAAEWLASLGESV